nr:ABC transporter permease [Streptococcus anginosus]
LCLGHFAFDIDLPSGAGSWGLLLLTIVLMTATSTALGMAIGRVRPSARAASALVTPIVLVVQFTSGIFFPLAQLPDW